MEAAIERLWLDDTAWVDVARGWLADADAVYEEVLARSEWRQGRLWRYERWVEEPRMGAWGPSAQQHPALVDAQRQLERHYRVRFPDGFALAYYRDGRDGQAFHRDRDMKWCENTVIALVTLGARRPWYLRPRANRHAHELENKGATHDLQPGPGDLMVMGGTCQLGWEHSVPQLRDRRVGGRISVQWRWTSRTGRQEVTAGYRAPLRFSRP
ncbi:MAG TPA: alpha-ketoglutarate-dependent dioxygenase AlkB [Acidimicrobiales bacterium]|nr:alpha-ketoglutarate-dependent dioxygenase AlkB [Acidimicrobiales bacterium]